jgi:PAS domain S-box-containing protein
MNTILIGVSLKDKVTHWNREAEVIFDIKGSDAIGKSITMMKINWEWDRVYEGISMAITTDCSVDMQEVRYSSVAGVEKSKFLNMKITPIKDYNESLRGFLLTGDDITENRAMRIRSNQSQKLESIGQLASGVAHEINTPTQYINDNTLFLKKAFESILPGITISDQMGDAQKKDIRFYIDEVPRAIDQTLEGISKISKIVSSMKQFSHPGSQEKVEYDICKIVDDAVTITRNEWKYVSDVEVINCEEPPILLCHPNSISQVLVNMIVNAAQAIEEKFGKGSDKKGRIQVEVRNDDSSVTVIVSDNGNGISDNAKEKIFDPFYTTKEVGKGTGQGLAIAFSVINTMHGGTIQVDSNEGQGTVFTIRLPKTISPGTLTA